VPLAEELGLTVFDEKVVEPAAQGHLKPHVESVASVDQHCKVARHPKHTAI